MRRALVLATLLLAGRVVAQPANGWQPLGNGWSELRSSPATGTVTTTGTLASGQVALGSGATSITGDSGCTWAGTGSSFAQTIATGANAIVLGGAAGLFGKTFGANYLNYGTRSNTSGQHVWVNSANVVTGTPDLALSRVSAGTLLVEDGSGNARDVQARTYSSPGSTSTLGFTASEITLTGSTYVDIFAGGSQTAYFINSGLVMVGGGIQPAFDGTLDIGASGTKWRTGYFGTSVVTPVVSGGADSATPNATAINGTNSRGGTDTNVAGGNLTIRPGAGTGSATGSSIVFQTPTATGSGTTGQTQTTRLTLSETAATIGVPIVAAAATQLQLQDTTGKYILFSDGYLYSPSNVTLGYNDSGYAGLFLTYTNTATVGAVTINKPSGRVNMALGASSIVVTNSLVTAASHVMVTRSAADTTCLLAHAIPAAGSFTITATAACAADTSYDFVVFGAD